MSGTLHISYQRNNSSASAGGCSENLAPRVLSRVAKEIRALHKEPPEGVRLVLDQENPGAFTTCLNEIVVSLTQTMACCILLTHAASDLTIYVPFILLSCSLFLSRPKSRVQ